MEIKTRFIPGDMVWTIVEGKARNLPLETVQINIRKKETTIQLFLNKGTDLDYSSFLVHEDKCFSTREELIESL
jgi:hypothetical protein